jgi:hypothetical protein
MRRKGVGIDLPADDFRDGITVLPEAGGKGRAATSSSRLKHQ